MNQTKNPNNNLTILILGLLTAFGPLSIDMYLPSFVSLSEEFAVPISQIQLTLGAFIIGMGAGQIFYGPLSDQYGRRTSLFVGLFLYICSSFLCIYAHSVEQIILLRFIQGLGGCAGTVMARAVVRDLYDGDDAAKIFSVLMLIMGVAPILAPTIGGFILSAYTWRIIFIILGCIGVLALINVLFFLKETNPKEKRNPRALKMAFSTYREIVKDKSFIGYLCTGGMIQGVLFSYITGSSFVFMKYYHLTESQYGLLFGLNAFGLIMASQVNRFLLSRMSINQIIKRVTFVNFICACFLLFNGITESFGFYGIAIPLFFCIASIGMVFPNTTAGALLNHSTHAGSASALLGTLLFVFGSSSTLTVSLFANGTLIPMTAVIFFCSLMGLSLFRFLVLRNDQSAVVDSSSNS